MFTNVTLLHYGCIGSSPVKPTVAITVRTLAVYRQTHCVSSPQHPRRSQKIVRYSRYLAEQLCTAFNVYLELQRQISCRLDKHLGRDTPNWRMLNSCPVCQYRLEEEPPLLYSIICACDGNNSAKLMDPAVHHGVERLDPRSGTSSIWLSEPYVDGFADEVGNAQKQSKKSRPTAPASSVHDPDDPWIEDLDSGDSSEPKMFAIFKKSGIFITVCRHGFLLTICNMVRSGELMKYPLASLNKLMEVFGKNILYSYDIKCALEKILLRSSLANCIKELNLQGVVPAFHGHAHNHLCQVQHHSKYKLGAGKEDFETCEHNATEFHRHQALDEHFRFADMDKYANLSNFLYNNYVQALEAIAATSTFLAESPIGPDAPFETDLADEKTSLEKMSCKQDATSVQVDYVKALVEYDDALLDLQANCSSKEIGNVRRHHTHTAAKCDQKQKIVEDFECQMEIDEHWGPDHPERIQAQSCITHRLFFKALDDVERLVVMRLLELTKLQMNGLGYKLRTQISKALKSLKNKYAAKMMLPRPPLEWTQIVKYSFLADDEQIQTKRWANLLYRQASTQYFDGVRAKEEVQRLNVEVGRLMTKIHDDAIYYPSAITALSAEDSPLASELSRQWDQLQSLNLWHRQRICQIQSLHGYSGLLMPGTRLGSAGGVEGYIEGLERHAADDL
ncbi:hypothetical protein DFJ58DRAFT_715712 [Suillus subalutaceus]|uniref:uncharacterized protein n=1 Tax=Suillus subalutaceus TaxID=48586 RepID=UPI001B884A8E|nr:uncharacterized protein DFJ58DRAFT_715712 [Suillus subalutaceus]KAG1859621.1 hypothetical protein DFJ58DRAFT_715712 [Suillus subalutaceus]